MRGFIAGILGLTMLQVAVTNSTRVAAAISIPAAILSRWLNPTIPLIPDLRSPQ